MKIRTLGCTVGVEISSEGGHFERPIDRRLNLLKHAEAERVNPGRRHCSRRFRIERQRILVYTGRSVPTYSNNNGNDRGVNRPRFAGIPGRCVSARSGIIQPSAREFEKGPAFYSQPDRESRRHRPASQSRHRDRAKLRGLESRG